MLATGRDCEVVNEFIHSTAEGIGHDERGTVRACVVVLGGEARRDLPCDIGRVARETASDHGRDGNVLPADGQHGHMRHVETTVGALSSRGGAHDGRLRPSPPK